MNEVKAVHADSFEHLEEALNRLIGKDNRWRLIQVQMYAAGACFTAWLQRDDS